MSKTENELTITALRRDPDSALRRLRASPEPLVVTRRGRPVAVLMGVEAHGRLEHDRELLRLLALGELESVAGEGEELDTVLDDADALLREN